MQAFDKYVHSNGRYGLRNFNHHRINHLRIFIEHCFGRFLVRLVVFLSDDELIFLLLFETMISQTFETSGTFQRFKFSFFRQLRRSFLMFVCLLVEK